MDLRKLRSVVKHAPLGEGRQQAACRSLQVWGTAKKELKHGSRRTGFLAPGSVRALKALGASKSAGGNAERDKAP